MRSRLRVSAVAAVLAIGAALAPGGAGVAQTAHTNLVIDGNRTMLTAFATANVPPAAANRLGAIVQAAVFDAVNGVEGRYRPIHVQPAALSDASAQAAAASAYHETLLRLFPAQQGTLDAAYSAAIGSIDDESAQSVTDGAAWGAAVADQVVAWRAADGFAAPPPAYTFSTDPGQWQPTPGGSGPPRFRTLATTQPFVLSSPAQFRPAGPPVLSSARYAQDLNELEARGGLVSSVRTAFETQTAIFWQVDTPVAQWDRVADTLAAANHYNLLRSARLLAFTNIAIADAIIAVFDAKNAYNFWRPATAIPDAGSDGNPDTVPDASWQPLLITPYFQEYPSAHTGVSSAAADVLAAFFGEDTSFTVTSGGAPGVTRSFTNFSDAVAQVADARILAGFHFRFSCDDGSVLGRQVATYVLANSMQPAGD
jgi:hypothetical protein